MSSPPRLFTIFLFLGLLHMSFHAFSQQDWNIPLTVLGDSTRRSFGEHVIITGIVRDINLRPVSGATLSVDVMKYFDYTDEEGRYTLELPPGDYRLIVRHVGLVPVFKRLRVFGTDLLNITLVEGAMNLEELVITSRPLDANVMDALGGLTKLNVAEIKLLPAFFGEVDVVKSIQTLPGVTSVGEGSAGFNVRGGRVDQNLILWNGVPVFNASHALGFLSAFNQDLAKDFTLYKGSVPAHLGGRASSVLEVNSRTGDWNEWKFQGGIGMGASRFTAEGPLVSTKTSLIMGGRVSHANWLLRQVRDPNVRRSRLAFSDFNATVAHRINSNSTLRFSYYTSFDSFQFSNRFGFDWSNHIAQGEWTSRADRKLSPTTSVAFGRYNSQFTNPAGISAGTVQNRLNYWQVREVLNYLPNDRHTFTVGLEAIAYVPLPDVQLPLNSGSLLAARSIGRNKGVEGAIFAHDEYSVSEKVSVSYGIRYALFQQLGRDTVFQYAEGVPRRAPAITDTLLYRQLEPIQFYHGPEPRISMRYSLSDRQSIKVSYNRMQQFIHLISNTIAPTPVDLWQVSNPFLQPQITDSFSAGYFRNFRDNMFETAVEGFYKTMQNLVEYRDFPELFLNRHLETELLRARGEACGFELFGRKLKGRWTGWIAYTFSRTLVQVPFVFPTETVNRGERYPANFDRPHNLNLVANRRLGRNGSFGLLFTYTSGRPITAIESSYIDNNVVIPIFSDRNQYRTPHYVRLDVSLTIGSVFRKINDSLTFSVFNLLGRENAYSVFYMRPSPNFQIPKPYQLSILGAALPSFTYNFNF
jgi:hypothetical protein